MKTAELPNTVEASYRAVKFCRACGMNALVEILNLGDQVLPRFTDSPNDVVPRAPLNLCQCAGCGLLQLQHTVEPDEMFRKYWYRSGINDSMKTALGNVVNDALQMSYTKGIWLDIGANDGYLLSRVPDKFTKVACEPALDFKEELGQRADHVINDYFSAKNVRDQGPFRIITSCAMFYDLDNPKAFVEDIKSVLYKDGVWVNQLNDAPTMMKQNAFDSICHEHLTYWSLGQLGKLYRDCGLKIIRVQTNDVNGGSIRIYAVHDDSPISAIDTPTGVSRGTATRFAERIKSWRDIMRDLIARENNTHGPVWGYGASTKAGTMLQYLDIPYAFHAIADRNKLKHGKFMGATRVKIVSEDDLRARAPRVVVPFIWAFRDEILERERDMRDMGTTMLFPLPNPEFVL